ncbi:histone deacetylase [Roseisolibacter sp. H3M3-2]|uniref:histone deacetylase family protein n=1 Tax=Roseisolibacter sp. H3M3-2 TaxID=3031323 RepID=UPI0023DC1612|nr:histone deacetylase [Roseisolibacter sp. H3M3-2]MDF1502153.1 histone deacetylase [Roseisolibacter sp. H3M3-2]
MSSPAQPPAPALALVSHADCGRHDTGWEHPEHVGRLRAVLRAVGRDPALFEALQHVEARHATPEALALGHDPGYVASVRAIAERGGGRLDADTVVSEGSWDAGTAGAGAALDALDLVMAGTARRAFAAVRPPGHHALRDSGMGFCLFGNVALAALHARARYGLERVLVVDWDVHHGNGTQAIVQHDPGVRFVSMHQWPWYPGTGAADDRGPHRSVWNVPMPPALARARYVEALERAVDDATDGWVPELLIVSAGFDCLAGDPLGGFTLEMEDVDRLTRSFVARAEAWCGGRLVSALEGGYAPDRVGEACVTHLHALVPAGAAR